MTFSPAAFYTIADELRHKAAADGPHLRTLISRAYYGALIEARDAKGLSTKGHGGHDRVIQAYMGSSSDKVVADKLQDLRKLREKADYQPTAALTRDDGLKALSACKRVLSILNKLPKPPAPPSEPPSDPQPLIVV